MLTVVEDSDEFEKDTETQEKVLPSLKIFIYTNKIVLLLIDDHRRI